MNSHAPRTGSRADASAHPPLPRRTVREVDRLAIEALGIPGVVLMENAGRNATDILLAYVREHRGLEPRDVRAAILCGGGNNGGDGYVIARHLHNYGAQVQIYAFKPPDELTGDAATHARICQRMGLPIELTTDTQHVATATTAWAEANVLVDALLGTGFSGEVRQPMAAAIEAVNALPRDREAKAVTVLAVDVPSGLDCDAGSVANVAVRADLTVTFVAAKQGFSTESARQHLGTLTVADIGAPPELIERARAAR